MVRSADYVRPVVLAQKVLLEAGITSFPVSLRQILRHYQFRMTPYADVSAGNDMSLEECFEKFGSDGATIAKNGSYLIAYNKDVTPRERIRFTVAHELGHIFLHHLEELGVPILQRINVNKLLYEVMEDEANCFARNLLCPPGPARELLRLHGFPAMQFDPKQNRNVWLKDSAAPCLPETPEYLRDFMLLQQAFMTTEKAAKTRCHFLAEDLANMPPADCDSLMRIPFTISWRCSECHAPRIDDHPYCYFCGARNLFVYIPETGPHPDPRPSAGSPFRTNDGLRLIKCLHCGRSRHDRDALFCVMCGKPVVNVCPRCSHRNISFARYCVKCGRQTVFAAEEYFASDKAARDDATKNAAFKDDPVKDIAVKYHAPPLPPEGIYSRKKRTEPLRRKTLAERDRKLKELAEKYAGQFDEQFDE